MLNDSLYKKSQKNPLMKESSSPIPRFLIIFAIVAVVTVVIIFWVSNSGKKKSSSETAATSNNAPTPTPPAPRFHQPVAATGQALDFSQALHGDALNKTIPFAAGAKTGIIVDMTSRRVLWERDCRKDVPIASMTKMMTLLLAMEALEADLNRSLDDEIEITKCVMKIERTGLAYLTPGEKIKFRDLIGCTVVKSANDAAQQLAEVSAGSVDMFVDRMNQRAKELGLSATFTNPTGLTIKGVTSTASALDMVLLGERLLEYPVVMDFMKQQEFAIRCGTPKETKFVTTNKLINPHYPGVDGMKTGYTQKAGSCLTFSVVRNNRRIIGCVTGFKSAQERDKFCRKLIDWAYQQK